MAFRKEYYESGKIIDELFNICYNNTPRTIKNYLIYYTLIMKTYFFTITFKRQPFSDEESCNKVVHADNIREAVNKVKAEMNNCVSVIFDNVYSEDYLGN